MEDKPKDEKEEKPTWYSLHKEQIKLIQWLLYHLKKHDTGGKEKTIRKEEKDFTVTFEWFY